MTQEETITARIDACSRLARECAAAAATIRMEDAHMHSLLLDVVAECVQVSARLGAEMGRAKAAA